MMRLTCQLEGSDPPCVSKLRLRAEGVQFEEDRSNGVTGITVCGRPQRLIISVSHPASNAAQPCATIPNHPHERNGW